MVHGKQSSCTESSSSSSDGGSHSGSSRGSSSSHLSLRIVSSIKWEIIFSTQYAKMMISFAYYPASTLIPRQLCHLASLARLASVSPHTLFILLAQTHCGYLHISPWLNVSTMLSYHFLWIVGNIEYMKMNEKTLLYHHHHTTKKTKRGEKIRSLAALKRSFYFWYASLLANFLVRSFVRLFVRLFCTVICSLIFVFRYFRPSSPTPPSFFLSFPDLFS